MSIYSEHLIATLLDLAQRTYHYGYDLDRDLTRAVVQVGRIIGWDVGCEPNDRALAWFAQQYGTTTPVRTRAAIHVLIDGRVGFGLGQGRPVIESAGDALAFVSHPEAGRYTGAWRLPTIEYGGLI